jgi:hypothetical protein
MPGPVIALKSRQTPPKKPMVLDSVSFYKSITAYNSKCGFPVEHRWIKICVGRAEAKETPFSTALKYPDIIFNFDGLSKKSSSKQFMIIKPEFE